MSTDIILYVHVCTGACMYVCIRVCLYWMYALMNVCGYMCGYTYKCITTCKRIYNSPIIIAYHPLPLFSLIAIGYFSLTLGKPM